MGCAAVLAGVRMSEGRNRVEFRDQADIRTRLSGIQHCADSRVSDILMRDPSLVECLDRLFSCSELLKSKLRMTVNVLAHCDDLRKDLI